LHQSCSRASCDAAASKINAANITHRHRQQEVQFYEHDRRG
jgi:hypothetical protein